MSMNRRQFLLFTGALASGCKAVEEGSESAKHSGGASRTVDAGPVSHFSGDGVYDTWKEQGFFVVRKGDKLVALSSYCTHRRCKLAAEPDRSFYCDCHGSTFDPSGKVTEGPAVRDLPVFPSTTNAAGHLIVTVTA